MKLSSKQNEFIELVKSGQNIFLTGKAGTGKSFIVSHAISELKKRGKRIVAIAPTGMAANHINGQTIHSMFSLFPYGVLDFSTCNFMKKEKRRLLDEVTTIFIDEVSMLRPDVLDAMNWTLLKNNCKPLSTKQIIFIGDMKQLPVVLDDNSKAVMFQKGYKGITFMDSFIYSEINPLVIELDEVLRQKNEEFVSNLNIIRDGGKSEYFKQFVSNDPSGIILAPHNSTAMKYNEDGLSKIYSKLLIFDAKVTGNINAEDFNLESKLRVKHGAKIMHLINSTNNPLRNGTIGEFISNKNGYFIKVKGVEYLLEKKEFDKKEYVFNYEKQELELNTIGSIEQYPIRLAYAMSIHKSQGMTFDEVTVDLTRPCFQKGQMYVALSRVVSPEGLKIIIK